MDRIVLERIRSGICAVGYITVKPEEYVKNFSGPWFKVVGTGFLVREGTVMTNRHVILALGEAQKEFGFPEDQKCVQFVHSIGESRWSQAFRKLSFYGVSARDDLDVGFIDFKADDALKAGCRPLVLGDLSSVVLGEAVGTCGYPYGAAMFQRGPGGKIYRFGPVLQQGWISGIAPFDDRGRRIDELLLDIRVAGGMSGSPVFRPNDGVVIGMVYASWEATTAVAVPVDGKRVDQWLRLHDEGRAKGSGTLVTATLDHGVDR